MTEPSYRYSSINNKISDLNTTKIDLINDSDMGQQNIIVSNNVQQVPTNVRQPLLKATPFNINSTNTSDFLENTLAPLARLETLDEKDDREVVNKPYPGVDDGFFSNNGQDKPADKDPEVDTDVEFIPRPKDPEKTDSNDDDNSIIPRAGPDNGHGDSDENDGFHPGSKGDPHHWPKFPVAPGFGIDFENGIGLGSGIGETIPDLNVYQHKKTLAQGMMDLALFSANANQLRYVLETFRNHPYFYPSMILISISLFLQVAVGIGLIWNATYNVKNERDLCRANKINNFTVIAIFLVTIINVFISAFGVSPAQS